MSFVLFNAADLPAAGSRSPPSLVSGGLPASGVESLYYLRSYAVVLVIALLGATPCPPRRCSAFGTPLPAAPCCPLRSPVALVLLLALCTAYLVDGSFNPFLYFRF